MSSSSVTTAGWLCPGLRGSWGGDEGAWLDWCGSWGSRVTVSTVQSRGRKSGSCGLRTLQDQAASSNSGDLDMLSSQQRHITSPQVSSVPGLRAEPQLSLLPWQWFYLCIISFAFSLQEWPPSAVQPQAQVAASGMSSAQAVGPMWWLALLAIVLETCTSQAIICPGRIQASSILGTLPGLWKLLLRPVMEHLTMATSLENQCWLVSLRVYKNN